MNSSAESDRVLIEHMLESAHYIQEAKQAGRDEFFNNRTLQLAVTYSLQILGEATRKLSAEAKSSEPKIPWKEIAGFRNRAAHEYFNIRLSIVWDTVEDDIPVLLDALHRMKQRVVGYDAHGH